MIRNTWLWRLIEPHLEVNEYAAALEALTAYEEFNPHSTSVQRWYNNSIRDRDLGGAFSWASVSPMAPPGTVGMEDGRMRHNDAHAFWSRIADRIPTVRLTWAPYDADTIDVVEEEG